MKACFTARRDLHGLVSFNIFFIVCMATLSCFSFFLFPIQIHAKYSNLSGENSTLNCNGTLQYISLESDHSEFDNAMISLYHSPEPLVRVLAYINSAKIQRRIILENELRSCLENQPSKIEQYIIIYVLASITRSEMDINLLMEHIFRFPYVVYFGAATEEQIKTIDFTLTELYPWIAHNTIYKRDAWLYGIICADFLCDSLTNEVRKDYLSEFPKEMIFPGRPLTNNKADSIYRAGGMSMPELVWFHTRDTMPDEEVNWLRSCRDMPVMEKTLLSEAWGRTFDVFLPLIDLGGKDAELARRIAEPALQKSLPPGGKYDRLLFE